jgi:hypothetical protein
VVEARDEREATAKAAAEFAIPPALRFKSAVTKLADKKWAAMIDWLINFVDWLVNLILGFLVIAFFVGLYIKLYESLRGIVMFFINVPRNTQVFIAEAKKRLAPDNKVPTSKTSQDDWQAR